MPHPIVIAAGMAIIVGAGYVIYTELNRNSEEEEAYHTYCATIRAEKEARNRRLASLMKTTADSHSSIHHQQGLRHRLTKQHITQQQVDYPLIDLAQQVYPPLPRSQRSPSPTPSSSSTKSDLKRLYSFSPMLDIPSPEAVIFIAPGLDESAEAEGSTASEEEATQLPSEDGCSSTEDKGSCDVADERPLIDWMPQEETTTLGHLLGVTPTTAHSLVDQTPLQPTQLFESSSPSPNQDPVHDQPSTSSHSLHDLIIPEASVNPPSTTGDFDNGSVTSDTFFPVAASPSLDGTWSDLGSDSFEHI